MVYIAQNHYNSILKPKQTNMKKRFTLLKKTFWSLAIIASANAAMAQVSFTPVGTGLQSISGSSAADCAVDMNSDGYDDIVRVTSGGIYVDYQQPDGTFTPLFYSMPIQNLPNWSICAADIDGNGYTDLCLGNGSRVSFVYASDDGTSFTEDAFPEYIFSQRTTFSDIDNDGNLDAFVCHDVDLSHPYRNVNGVLELDFNLINTLDAGGNYAAIWVDYDNDYDADLYITKCRGGAPVGDPQRINLLYRNNGDGTFTSVGPQANMDDGDQSWATAFEDFDNDGDFDAFTVNHSWANRFMRNNGDGTFTDIIGTTGITANDLGAWNCDAADFDNNGWVDIFSEMNNEMYWNNGDGTFTGGNLSFSSGGIGDFNHDGFLDVIRGNTRHMNNGNNNNWVKFDLEGIVSNKEGIGARVEIYGDFGMQIREVRAGRSFDPASSLIAHFGLGQHTSISQVVVRWPSGMVTSIENPAINQQHFILESSCTNDPVAITANGSTQICEGQSVELVAPQGSMYVWSNGGNNQVNTVTASGSYSVFVFDEEGCVSSSNVIDVEVVSETAPTIAINGPTYFCSGESVQLVAGAGSAFEWSNGAEGAQIEVTESGDYYVSVVSICTGNMLSSEIVSVEVLTPATPVVEDIQIGEPGSVELTATGSNVEWFATETSDEVLATGNTFITPEVTDTYSVWAQNSQVFPGEAQSGGKPTIDGSGGLPSQGGIMFFNASEPFILKQVTCVIPAGGSSGMRTIVVRDAANNIIAQTQVDLQINAENLGTFVVDLDFEIPAGNGHQISCTENNLFRNNGGVSFPYPIGTVGEITNTTFGTSYYYYFYDWKIEKMPTTCVSPRVEVSVAVVGVDELSSNPFNVNVYPNPVNTDLFFSTGAEMTNAELIVSDAVGRRVIERQFSAAARATQTLNVSDLSAGVYYLTIEKDGLRSVLDFVVE